MPMNLGFLSVRQTRKEHICGNPECKEPIKPQELVAAVAIVPKNRSKHAFSQMFHLYCLSDFVHIKAHNWLPTKKTPGGINRFNRATNPETPLQEKLPVEVYKRRLTLLKYLNNHDIGMLTIAYEKDRKERATVVKALMGKRMRELQAIDQQWGITSPWWVMHLHDFPYLMELVVAKDLDWWQQATRYFDDREGMLTLFEEGVN